MNENEIKFFSKHELSSYDLTRTPFTTQLKSIFVKLRRRTYGKIMDRNARFVWTLSEVADTVGPAFNVRNYIEMETIRNFLKYASSERKLSSACEIGCGYGRVIMVLKEYADRVTGFERETELIEIASNLLPTIDFIKCDNLGKLSLYSPIHFDFSMTCTVLQHLTDEFCQSVLQEIRTITPKGWVLLIEKTESIFTTKDANDGDKFISRARTVSQYEEWMKPFMLVRQDLRRIEPGYNNPAPGTCMLFKGQG